MLELDELDDLHVVPDRAEQLGPGGIRHLGRESLTQRAVAEQRREGAVLELGQQLVLAARHGEDHRRPGPYRAIERVVGGGVAGVQADDEVDARERLVAGDVADLEPEAVGRRAFAPAPRSRATTSALRSSPTISTSRPCTTASRWCSANVRYDLPEPKSTIRSGPAGSAGSTSSTSSRKRLTCRNLS